MSTTITQNGGTLEIQQLVIGGALRLQYKNATSSIWTNISSFPVTIVNGTPTSSSILTVNFTTNITFTSTLGGANGYFICGSSYIIFDGLSYTVNIIGISNYPGLFQNSLTTAYHTITIKNINTASSSTSVNGGYICQTNFGRNIKNIPGFDASTNFILIENCSNSGAINNVNSAGICGQFFGSNSVAHITNCSNTGSMTQPQTAGICGANTCNIDGTVTITNCYNTANLNQYGGGIVGIYVNTGYTEVGSLTISGCYNTGTIGREGGGICGPLARGKIYVYNCYNTGNITGQFAGGIVGADFNANAYTSTPCTITNCYTIGAISGNNSGGICGAGICVLENVSLVIRAVNITNCYTLGNIATGAGGILGGPSANATSRYPENTRVTLTNCFSNGIVTNVGSGLIANTSDIKPYATITSCYIGNNAWSDATAQTSLTGAPTDININNPGTTWITVVTDTPYVLSAYDSEIYNPNTVSITTVDYDSSEGLFQPGYTYSIVSTNKSVDTGLIINAANGILSYTDIPLYATITTYVFASKFISGKPYAYNCNTLTIDYPICFKEDSEILCLIDNEEKYVKIQEMKPNMLVKTYNEEYVAIDTIGWFMLDNQHNNERHPNGLYELTKEKYPELTENLILTGKHCILVDNLHAQVLNTYKFSRHAKLDNKYKLPCIANEDAIPYKKEGLFKIWSFCLESEDKTKNFGIYANGMLVESTNKQDINNFELNCVE